MPAPLGERLVLRREYPDPVEDVWAAFTESERLGRWIGTYTGRGRTGGSVEWVYTGEVDAGGEVAEPATLLIHECDAPRRLVVEVPAVPGQVWVVEVDLTPSGGGTVLEFRQQLIEGMNRADVEAGWSWYLDRLGASLRSEPMPDWTDYAPAGT